MMPKSFHVLSLEALGNLNVLTFFAAASHVVRDNGRPHLQGRSHVSTVLQRLNYFSNLSTVVFSTD